LYTQTKPTIGVRICNSKFVLSIDDVGCHLYLFIFIGCFSSLMINYKMALRWLIDTYRWKLISVCEPQGLFQLVLMPYVRTLPRSWGGDGFKSHVPWDQSLHCLPSMDNGEVLSGSFVHG